MIRDYNTVGAMISSPSGILVREDSLQNQRKPSYFTNEVNDIPSGGRFLANMRVIAIDDRASEETNNVPTVSQNALLRQEGSCSVLRLAVACHGHVNGQDTD